MLIPPSPAQPQWVCCRSWAAGLQLLCRAQAARNNMFNRENPTTCPSGLLGRWPDVKFGCRDASCAKEVGHHHILLAGGLGVGEEARGSSSSGGSGSRSNSSQCLARTSKFTVVC
jgi:hypothetical protein